MDHSQDRNTGAPTQTLSRVATMHIVVSGVLLIFGVGIGFAGGWYSATFDTRTAEERASNQALAGDRAGGNGSYQDGFNAARERLIEQGVIVDSGSSETDTIYGRVIETNASEVVVEANPVDPLSDAERYTVAINDETTLQTAVPLSLDEFDAALIEHEMAANEMEPDAEVPPPPEPFDFSPLRIRDIAVGDEVMVRTEQVFERGSTQRLVAEVFQKQEPAVSEDDGSLPDDE